MVSPTAAANRAPPHSSLHLRAAQEGKGSRALFKRKRSTFLRGASWSSPVCFYFRLCPLPAGSSGPKDCGQAAPRRLTETVRWFQRCSRVRACLSTIPRWSGQAFHCGNKDEAHVYMLVCTLGGCFHYKRSEVLENGKAVAA